jgi:hypothetical protein
MSKSNYCEFRQLFASVWSTFKSNYLLCLGVMVPAVLLMVILMVGRVSAGIWVTGDGSNILSGQIASIAFWFLFASLIVSPVVAYLLYRIVRRVRQGPGACAGRYVQIVVLMLIGNACLLPGTAIIAASNANEYVAMELSWDLINDAIQLRQGDRKEQESLTAKDESARKDAKAQQQEELAKVRETKERLHIVQSRRNVGMGIGGFLVMLGGVLFLLTWLPWSVMASLDPEENKSDVTSAIRRGREIAAGGLWPIFGVYLVITVISIATTAACVLPGLFFGIPLALAMVPGMYMCMRGESETCRS